MLVNLLGIGCVDPGTSSPPADPTGQTGTTLDPASIAADCAPTANALRFVCQVTVDPPQAVRITVARADGTGAPRVHESLAAAEHELVLTFLAGSTAYDFTAEAAAWPEGRIATGTFTTGAVPTELVASLDVTGVSSTPYVGSNPACGTAGATAAVWDTRTGEMVWYEEIDPEGSFGGFHMVTFTEDHTVLGESGGQVTEVDLTGAVRLLRREGVDYAEELHHDLIKRDGRIYLLYQQGEHELDGFLIWDETGAEIGRWWGPDALPIPEVHDWMHTNTIFAQDGAVSLSLYSQNTIVKVDGDPASPTFGAPEWVLGGSAPMGLGTDFSIDWSGVRGSDTFARQHHVQVLADGRLAMLDNANGRGLVLTLDEAARTATADEAYPATSRVCDDQGTMGQTAAGSFLVGCSGGAILEYAPGGTTPVWEAQMVCPNGSFIGGAQGARWYALDGW